MKYSIALVSLVALISAGCGGRAAVPASTPMRPADNVAVIPLSDVAPDSFTGVKVGVRLTGEQQISDPRYHKVLGYFKGTTSTTSQVVSLPAATQVKFRNVDTVLTHTASFLGDATATSAPWPSTFNGSFSASPAGKAIGTAGFSTGPLSPGQKSLIYNTGMPGFYMIGCYFHYNPDKMRTVIIVM